MTEIKAGYLTKCGEYVLLTVIVFVMLASLHFWDKPTGLAYFDMLIVGVN